MSDSNRKVYAGLIGALLGVGVVMLVLGQWGSAIPLFVIAVAMVIIMRNASKNAEVDESAT